ncbi:hypothetical protein PENARI_c130G10775 [Penicillium arizonense]|uniref:Uncharacterized protein n=1 Tax=Penicillium arizonense TaxID=1835702 RepID=A0A1F5L144_PENAI|nr:hypothetical protein PENARI_c130G10775 [Penicillium arizonense]OGE46710.1 hypothetical protein PENARI_c130G10775 [Penicillium arizonense]
MNNVKHDTSSNWITLADSDLTTGDTLSFSHTNAKRANVLSARPPLHQHHRILCFFHMTTGGIDDRYLDFLPVDLVHQIMLWYAYLMQDPMERIAVSVSRHLNTHMGWRLASFEPENLKAPGGADVSSC